MTDVAIVGAGPYGLSLAAQLRQARVDHRVFGQPMELWQRHMPKGMLLKSEGFASCLYDGAGRHTLRAYCEANDLPYEDIGLPVPLATFYDYALAFQRELVPDVSPHKVVELARGRSSFELFTDSNERVVARRVVVAVGVRPFRHVPRVLCGLPQALASHSSDHSELGPFAGKEVAVLGGGSSAIDLAALLNEAGARVRLVVRCPQLEIHTRMRLPRPLADRLREPMSGIGPSWRSWFFTNLPQLFHRLPTGRRLKWVRTHLGPAGGWFMAERVHGRFPVLTGRELTAAREVGGRVMLQLWNSREKLHETMAVDHVVAATGFRIDLGRLAFLAPSLRTAIASVEHTPVLSAGFESSVPGLYFAGPAAANSFGPVMRFAVGARFAAGRLARELARSTGRPEARVVAAPRPTVDGLNTKPSLRG